MRRYDPLDTPDPDRWLELDEGERIALVQSYHERAGERGPEVSLHASIHVIVENQIALGDETPVQATLERLQSEGLDRHDAIHAIGSVLVDHLENRLASTATATEGPNEAYCRNLKSLTAQSWLESGS